MEIVGLTIFWIVHIAVLGISVLMLIAFIAWIKDEGWREFVKWLKKWGIYDP